MQGAPCFRGTRIPVHTVAEIAIASGVDAAKTTYARLTRPQIERACLYAKAYPRRGRPEVARRRYSREAQAKEFKNDFSEPRLNERIAGFLIDECLSGELADLRYYGAKTRQDRCPKWLNWNVRGSIDWSAFCLGERGAGSTSSGVRQWRGIRKSRGYSSLSRRYASSFKARMLGERAISCLILAMRTGRIFVRRSDERGIAATLPVLIR